MNVTLYELSRDMLPEEWPAELVASSDYFAVAEKLDKCGVTVARLKHELKASHARLAEAERKLAKAEEWRDYYRAKWMGPIAVPQLEPPADSAPAGQYPEWTCPHCGWVNTIDSVCFACKRPPETVDAGDKP